MIKPVVLKTPTEDSSLPPLPSITVKELERLSPRTSPLFAERRRSAYLEVESLLENKCDEKKMTSYLVEKQISQAS
jgi:hypothetical protein